MILSRFPWHSKKFFSREIKKGGGALTSRALKKLVRSGIEKQLANKAGFNIYHKKLAELGYSHILTTNYDYGVEASFLGDFFASKKKYAVDKREKRYSLKRGYKDPKSDLRIWHINGELFDSRVYKPGSSEYPESSIMLGYEHYASYLAHIQEVIRGARKVNVKGKKVEIPSLFARIRNENECQFWTDILFTHDVDIVGQGFDFSEVHLWWLVNHRAALLRSGKSKGDASIDNTIKYYFPIIESEQKISHRKSIDDEINRRNSMLRTKAIAELLSAFFVEPISVECDSYPEFYEILTTKSLISK